MKTATWVHVGNMARLVRDSDQRQLATLFQIIPGGAWGWTTTGEDGTTGIKPLFAIGPLSLCWGYGWSAGRAGRGGVGGNAKTVTEAKKDAEAIVRDYHHVEAFSSTNLLVVGK